MENFIRSSSSVSFGIFMMLAGLSCGNFPVLDVDTNMRIVLVPYDTPVGTIIYRLRASDSDNNFPLSFEVLGSIGKSILSLRLLGCEEAESLCQADVVLKKALDKGRTYEFELQVKDTVGDYTRVHSVLTATSGTANFNPTFMPRIIHLDESTPVGTELERFVVAKNELNSRHVLLEIRDKGDRIALKQRLVSNNKTEGTLLLKKTLDYETEPWFTFQLLAMNAYTNTSCDTRNILVTPVIVAVHDVQDAPPYFTSLPASVELQSSMKPGDLIATVAAQDGDKQNKRLIRYGFLTDSNPFVVFFDLDPMSGEIHLRRNLTELLAMAKPNEPIEMTVIAEEIIPDSGRLVGKSSPTRASSSSSSSFNDRTMGKITFWFGKGSAFGPAIFSSDKYVGEVKENSVSGTLVQFGSTEPRVSHQHPKEIISLSLQPGGASNKIDSSRQINTHPTIHQQDEGVEGFQVMPSQGSGNFSFEIRITDPKQLDYETTQQFTFLVVAVTSCGMSSEAQVTIHVRDENDESPVFSQAEYHVELPEHAAKGTRVLQVQAIDKDTSGSYGRVTYSNLIGSNAFRLDPVTGDITVDRPELIDREMEPEIRLYVEAKDGGYSDSAESNAVRNLGTAMVVIKLTDKNDHPPEFLQKYYQAILNPGLTELKEPLFVKAFDPDEGVNSQIRYQIKDTRFYVDPISGEFRLRGGFHRDPKDGDNPFLGTVRVYAYDLGNPKMTSESSVQLFSEEMVTREIQFVFPGPPDRIRRNKTNFEIMLSKLSGGVVAIQNVAPYRSRRSGSQVQGDDEKEPETNSSGPGEDGTPARFRQTQQDNPDSNSALTRRASDLSSASDKSLVTATVQYPVGATPTRVDLSQIPNVYGSGSGDTGSGPGGPDGNGGTDTGSQGPADTDRIKLYEAENRALFWILISFLLILLILFAVFLCCVYCPWCWLYGHCYSKGDKMSREHSGRSLLLEKRRQSDTRSRHKTYPEKIEDEEADYDREGFTRPPAPPARGHRHARREAWSGEERKVAWRTSHQSPRSIRRYRGTPPPRSRKVGPGGPPPHETDVALEDWEFDQGPPPRARDQAEEIGSRWQLQQQPMPLQQQPQQQIMPVAVPVGVQPSRRVAFGHPSQVVDDGYVRRSQEVYMADENQRGGYIVRPTAQSIAAGADERAVSHLQQRKARFFRTETGEVLQFGDYEGDEGKELLMKRYIDEQQPNENEQYLQQQKSFGSQHRSQTPGAALSQQRLVDDASRGAPVAFVADSATYGQEKQRQQHEQLQQSSSIVDRPKAAIVTRRQQKPSLTKDVTFEDDDVDDGDDARTKTKERESRKKREESTSQQAISRSDTQKSSKKKSESESDGADARRRERDKERDDDQRRQRRAKEAEKKRRKSPTPPSEDDDDGRRSRSPTRRSVKDKRVSKSPSRSKTRSQSPPSRFKSKSKSKSPSRSKSRTRSRSASPSAAEEQQREKQRRRVKQGQTQDREGKAHKLKRHHHIQHQASKASSRGGEEQDRDRSHHHRLKQKDSSSKQPSKESREELTREKSKSLQPSLTSLPLSIDETEPTGATQPQTSSEDVQATTTAASTTVVVESEGREESPPSPSTELDRRRRRSSVFREDSEDASQMQNMVDINIIPPSSAMTDSSYNPRDADGMSDAAPPTPDAGESAPLPETTISTTGEESKRRRDLYDDDDDDDDHARREEDEDEETRADEIEGETQPAYPGTSQSAAAVAATADDDDEEVEKVVERSDTLPEPEDRLGNDEIIASQSTLDIAEAETAAAALAPSDSVDIPPPGDAELEPSDRLRGPEEDDDSGIGMIGYLSRRNKMLEKKSVFTIAYDEVAQSAMMRPDTRGSTGETEHEIPTSVK